MGEAERWLDDRVAPPGSTVWVIWQPNGDGIDVKAIVSSAEDVDEYERLQPGQRFCSSEWRVLGAGWPAGQPNQTKE